MGELNNKDFLVTHIQLKISIWPFDYKIEVEKTKVGTFPT